MTIFNLNDELASAGVLLLSQVLSTGLEVVKHILLVAMCTAIMPFQAILPSASAQPQISVHLSQIGCPSRSAQLYELKDHS